MKGVVFTEFSELVEEQFGLQMLDDLLSSCPLESGGIYTAVGTYDCQELITLVTELSRRTGIATDELVVAFGEFLFARLASGAPQFCENIATVGEFLGTIEGVIHVEVRKLYPDAQLPSLNCRQLSETETELLYRSNRPLAAFAEGLIRGCAAHFGETFELQREDLPGAPGTCARFVYRKLPVTVGENDHCCNSGTTGSAR